VYASAHLRVVIACRGLNVLRGPLHRFGRETEATDRRRIWRLAYCRRRPSRLRRSACQRLFHTPLTSESVCLTLRVKGCLAVSGDAARGIHRGVLVAVWVDVTVRSKLFQAVFLTSDVVQDNAALGQSGGEVGGERHQLVETDR
jgi:hypothetical protein